MQIERVTYETLEEIKDFYRTVVQKMCDEEIFLWDEIYPIEFLQKDIESNELFCLRNNHEILAAFTLCKTGDGAEAIEWSPERDGENIFYLYRFAVNAHHKRTGLGSVALKHIFATAQKQGATTVRFFVETQNLPALSFYKKQGIAQRPGLYVEEVDENLTLREYGFEKDLTGYERNAL